mgnify:FL=1
MEYQLLQSPHLRAIGVAGVVPSSFAPDAAEAVVAIEELWMKLCRHIDASPGDPRWDFVGITTPADEHVPPQRINYVAAVTSQSSLALPQGLDDFTINAGWYAVFNYLGPHDGLDEFYRVTYMEKLPALGLTTRDGQHLERYPSPSDAESISAEAWIPVDKN